MLLSGNDRKSFSTTGERSYSVLVCENSVDGCSAHAECVRNSSGRFATCMPAAAPTVHGRDRPVADCGVSLGRGRRRRLASADDAALSYPVEFLVKFGLLVFDGATGAVDGVVNGIVEFDKSSTDTSGETKTQKRIQSSTIEMSTFGAGSS